MSAPPGLATVATAISTFADGGLWYRGYPVTELATRSTFPAVAHLLWTGAAPEPSSALTTEQAMIAARNALLPRAYRDGAAPVGECLPACAAGYAAWLRDTPPAADATPLARSAAAVGALAAVMARVSRGHERRPPRAARFAPGLLELARGTPVRPDEAQVFEAWCVLAAEHELTVSTFAARVIATTGADPAYAVLAGLVALHGPLHGGAFAAIRTMLTLILRGADAGEVLERAAPPAGFGHRSYPTGDPRARTLRSMLATLPPSTGPDWVSAADRLAEAGEAAGYGPATLDLYAVALLRQLGSPPALDTTLFAVARAVGWTAHAMEQLADNRMTRPTAHYLGPPPRRLSIDG